LDWIVQCFTSPPTQYRLYGRRVFTGQKTQPTVSKVLKEKAVKEKKPPKHKENTNYTYAYRHKIAYKYSKHE